MINDKGNIQKSPNHEYVALKYNTLNQCLDPVTGVRSPIDICFSCEQVRATGCAHCSQAERSACSQPVTSW